MQPGQRRGGGEEWWVFVNLCAYLCVLDISHCRQYTLRCYWILKVEEIGWARLYLPLVIHYFTKGKNFFFSKTFYLIFFLYAFTIFQNYEFFFCKFSLNLRICFKNSYKIFFFCFLFYFIKEKMLALVLLLLLQFFMLFRVRLMIYTDIFSRFSMAFFWLHEIFASFFCTEIYQVLDVTLWTISAFIFKYYLYYYFLNCEWNNGKIFCRKKLCCWLLMCWRTQQ